VTLTVKMVGDAEFKRYVKGVSDRARNPARAMKVISLAMQRDVLKHFADESGEDGRWTDLTPATWAWKLKHGKTMMLQNTGHLRSSNITVSGKTFASVVNNSGYGRSQNDGNSSRNLPARPFMWLSDDTIEHIKDLMGIYLMEGI
jgi:phage gpG-like protein